MTLYISTPWRRMMQRRIMDQDGGPTSERDVFFPVDVKAEADAFVISALLPGVKPDDLNVQVVNETVSIQGSISHEDGDADSYLLQERPSGRFYRSLTLPDTLGFWGGGGGGGWGAVELITSMESVLTASRLSSSSVAL